jgi:hypothetical protein
VHSEEKFGKMRLSMLEPQEKSVSSSPLPKIVSPLSYGDLERWAFSPCSSLLPGSSCHRSRTASIFGNLPVVANTLSHSFSGVKIANHAMGRPGIRVILFRDGRYCRGLGGNGFFFGIGDWDELGGRAEGVTLTRPRPWPTNSALWVRLMEKGNQPSV